MNTHETYVSLEVAKLLKQAGFDWDTYSVYNKDGVFADKNRSITRWNDFADYYSAPTLSVAQKWLREVKGWECQVAYGTDENGNKSYVTELINPDVDLEDYMEYFPIYEEALEAGIKKCLELLLK